MNDTPAQVARIKARLQGREELPPPYWRKQLDHLARALMLTAIGVWGGLALVAVFGSVEWHLIGIRADQLLAMLGGRP